MVPPQRLVTVDAPTLFSQQDQPILAELGGLGFHPTVAIWFARRFPDGPIDAQSETDGRGQTPTVGHYCHPGAVRVGFMARPLRYDPDDGWHHVMNRGVARQAVFLAARDGRMFEWLLNEARVEFGVEIHAYCLMTNHYHLLVHCPDAGLSPFMQRLSSRYTQYLNRRVGRDGPVFRGRFRSLFIDSERYLSCAGRYIHRNPLDIRPRVELAKYRWSSFRAYCGEVEVPPWLDTSILAPVHGGSDGYRQYVVADFDSAPVGGALDWAIATAVAEFEAETAPEGGHLHRTVALLALDMADGAMAATLDESLSFPTSDARRLAMSRAHQRLAKHQVLGAMARRALELAA